MFYISPQGAPERLFHRLNVRLTFVEEPTKKKRQANTEKRDIIRISNYTLWQAHLFLGKNNHRPRETLARKNDTLSSDQYHPPPHTNTQKIWSPCFVQQHVRRRGRTTTQKHGRHSHQKHQENTKSDWPKKTFCAQHGPEIFRSGGAGSARHKARQRKHTAEKKIRTTDHPWRRRKTSKAGG